MSRAIAKAASTAPALRVLIADDQPDVLEALRLLFRINGFEPHLARSPREVEAALENGAPFEALLMDLNYARDTTSGQEGMDLLGRVRALDAQLPIVVMTAWGSIAGAVDAIRRGARDYVTKPWDDAHVLALVRAQAERRTALRRVERLAQENQRLRAGVLPSLVSNSPAMAKVQQLVERVAASDASVLVRGEHGTGKEVVARWLHALSSRADEAFVPLDTGAVAESLFESELFGHTRGAFTGAQADRAGCFELADRGTLFLDELGNLPMGQQPKLLRALQTGEVRRVGGARALQVDVRVISATNAALGPEQFRQDLLYRLNTVEIALPPLRQRPEDVPVLARGFLRRFTQRYKKAIEDFTPDALAELRRHAWPGNVRELEHAIERAVLLAQGPAVTGADLGLRAEGPTTDLERMTLDEAERALIERAVTRAAGNVTEAARALGVSRSALYRRLQRPEDADGEV